MVFKRGKQGIYWYRFQHEGKVYRRSTKQRDKEAAKQIESAYRTALCKGDVGIIERVPAPTLTQFAARFKKNFGLGRKRQPRPSTQEFYGQKLDRLMEFEPLASARLDQIKGELIETFVCHRRAYVSPAEINRELATLRRLLHVAHDLEPPLIDRIPKITMQQGERERDFVLAHDLERTYLSFAPQPLQDLALLMLDTGLRISEALGLEWREIHLLPVGRAQFGFIQVRDNHWRQLKSKYARRNIPLTPRVEQMLSGRAASSESLWAFPNEEGSAPRSYSTVKDQHEGVRRALRKAGMNLPDDFVIHSFRHTFGTRLGATGADAFSIMRAMGHSSVLISQKYVHPTPRTLEWAFDQMQAANEREIAMLPPAQPGQGIPSRAIIPYTKTVTGRKEELIAVAK